MPSPGRKRHVREHGPQQHGIAGVNNWDLALSKNFKLTERWSMQFRGEFFNALNHPSFDAVGALLNTTASGSIRTSTALR